MWDSMEPPVATVQSQKLCLSLRFKWFKQRIQVSCNIDVEDNANMDVNVHQGWERGPV